MSGYSDDNDTWELEEAWRFLGKVLFATPVVVRQCVQYMMRVELPAGFRRRYRASDLEAACANGGPLVAPTRSLLYAGVDMRRLSEACIDEFAELGQVARIRGLTTSVLARRAMSSGARDDDDDGAGGGGGDVLAETAAGAARAYHGLDVVGSLDLMLEQALQHVAPGMRLPYADDLIVPEITIFVIEMLRHSELAMDSIARRAMSLGNGEGAHRFRIALLDGETILFRLWTPVFLELNMKDIFTSSATRKGTDNNTRGADECQIHPIQGAIAGIRQYDMDLTRSFAHVTGNSKDTRYNEPRVRQKYDGFRFADALYADFDGWLFVLTYLLEIATAIDGACETCIAQHQHARLGQSSSEPPVAAYLDARACYLAYIRWFESAISAIIFVRTDDEWRHPNLLRVGGITVFPQALADTHHEWAQCLDSQSLLEHWHRSGAVTLRADSSPYYYPGELHKVHETYIRTGDTPMQQYANSLARKVREHPVLLSPLRTPEEEQAWYDEHMRILGACTMSASPVASVWKRIRTGLGTLLAHYSTGPVLDKWRTADDTDAMALVDGY